MFKEIKAVFKTVKDTAYLEEKWDIDRSDFEFKVERVESGASNYGDRSAHLIEVTNHPEVMVKHFDTRYSGIPTTKEEWVNFWRAYIEDYWVLEVKLISYEEQEVEIENKEEK